VREGLRRGHARVHELDGKRPTWITQAPKPKGRIGERFFRTYVDACDIQALDLYPISDPLGKHADIPNKLPSAVGDYADRLASVARAATAAGHPKWVWMVLQGAGWSGVIPRDERGRYIGPSLMQPAAFMFRYMVYQSIIHGAQGIVVFGMNVGLYPDVKRYGWDWGYWRHAVVPVLQELRSPGLAGALAVQQPGTVQCHTLGPRGVRIDTLAVRNPEGAQFLLASRSERKRGEPREAELALPLTGLLGSGDSRAPAGSAEVLFEDRHALVQRGTIEDRFAPHEVHVYRLSA
jgi:hypothetical protein